MSEVLEFPDRAHFRRWLSANSLSQAGVWLRFGKADGSVTLTAAEALEEALCFGWIDGRMQRVDDKTYKKYFSPRRENSNWSEKNKALVEKLEQRGLMTDYGRTKIAVARKTGRWDAPKAPPITEEQIEAVYALLDGHEPACTNFRAMPLSVRKTYTRAWFDAKTEAGRAKRLAWMLDRLDKNLKPM